MSTQPQPYARTPLIPPITVKYQIVWQETPTRGPEPGEGNIIISVTDITTIADGSRSQALRYMAVAKLSWGQWEANFGCTYYPMPSIFLEFECLMMNDAMRNDVQGGDVDHDEERNGGSDNAKPKFLAAPIDDHHNRMLRVEVEGAMGSEGVSSFEQTRGVKLWAKRVVGDEVKLSRAGKDRLKIE